MKRIISLAFISIFLVSCKFGEYRLPMCCMYLDYNDLCSADDFKIDISVGLYPYGTYKKEWHEDECAFLYVENTTNEKGQLKMFDLESGTFLFIDKGIEDVYGFDNSKTIEKESFAFTKEFVIDKALFNESSGWITFVSGMYDLEREDGLKNPSSQNVCDCHYSISDNFIKFERFSNKTDSSSL